MSVIAYVFDQVADPQDYSVTVRASFYTRWPLTTVPGQSMKPIPTASPKIVNHVRDQAESYANELLGFVTGGLSTKYGPQLMRGAGERFGQWVQGAEEAAVAAETEMEVLAWDGAEIAALG